MSNFNKNAQQPSVGHAGATAPEYHMLLQSGSPNFNPIVAQPKQGELPQVNHLSGLQLLATIDKLHIKQKVDTAEVVFNIDTPNSYLIKNQYGANFFWAYEESDECERCCNKERRAFKIHVVDFQKNPVLLLDRPYASECCCSQSDLHTAEVFAPPGCPVGSIQQTEFFSTNFVIKNPVGDILLTINGPSNTDGWADFKFVGIDGKPVGQLTKKWSGFFQELGSKADNFELTFPLDMDVRIKAILLGLVFFIDAKYYEN